jgi:hypothetical protein
MNNKVLKTENNELNNDSELHNFFDKMKEE